MREKLSSLLEQAEALGFKVLDRFVKVLDFFDELKPEEKPGKESFYDMVCRHWLWDCIDKEIGNDDDSEW